MRIMRIVIILLLLASLMAAGNAQQASYAGKANIVLEILSLNRLSPNYQGSDYTPPYYNVLVLYSSDPAIKEGGKYRLEIDARQVGYWGITSGITPKEFVDGTIVGINDYSFDGSKISVVVAADPGDKDARDNAWKQKIAILGSADTGAINYLAGNPDTSALSAPFSMPFMLDLPASFPAGPMTRRPFNFTFPDMELGPSSAFAGSPLFPGNQFSWPSGPVRYRGPLTIK